MRKIPEEINNYFVKAVNTLTMQGFNWEKNYIVGVITGAVISSQLNDTCSYEATGTYVKTINTDHDSGIKKIALLIILGRNEGKAS